MENTEFKRAERLGFNILDIEQGVPVFVKVKSDKIETFERKDADAINFVDVTNLKTGEEQRMWVSGQLRYQLETYLKSGKTLNNAKFEILLKGQTPGERNGEKVKINNFDVFVLQ